MYSVVKRILLGSPLSSAELEEQRLSKRVALAVFGTDAVASTAFATQEILVVLVPARTARTIHGLRVSAHR